MAFKSPTIFWNRYAVKLIDQTVLPAKTKYITCTKVEQLWHAIKTLKVRGAPAIGVAAGFGVLLGAKNYSGTNRQSFDKEIFKICDYLASSRPTAVNLFNSLEQMRQVVQGYPFDTVIQIKKRIEKKALEIYVEDQKVCRQIGKNGMALIRSGLTVLTVCNAGALATVDYGTALGVMYAAFDQGRKFTVYSCETRPLLQGARLTCWELKRAKIPVTLICDSMAATLMKQGRIDMVLAGADRIAANGDTANKIGTYSLAVLARYHRIPFYIAAPRSTFDFQIKDGSQIPIEERKQEEVTAFVGVPTAPKGIGVYNPAFDVTPHELISGIISEFGIVKGPNRKRLEPWSNI